MDIERIDWWGNELNKCKENPYHFVTNYLLVNGKKFTTLYTEKEFNEQHKKVIQDHLEQLIKKTNGNTIHPK